MCVHIVCVCVCARARTCVCVFAHALSLTVTEQNRVLKPDQFIVELSFFVVVFAIICFQPCSNILRKSLNYF